MRGFDGVVTSAAAEAGSSIRKRLEDLLSVTQNRLTDRFDTEIRLPAHLSSRDRTTIMLDLMKG